MALGLQPQHASTTVRLLAELSDEICHFAGLRAHDVSWYTDRAFVLELYASTGVCVVHGIALHACLNGMHDRIVYADGQVAKLR